MCFEPCRRAREEIQWRELRSLRVLVEAGIVLIWRDTNSPLVSMTVKLTECADSVEPRSMPLTVRNVSFGQGFKANSGLCALPCIAGAGSALPIDHRNR